MELKVEILNIGEEERHGSFVLTLFGQIRLGRFVFFTKTDVYEIDQHILLKAFTHKNDFIENSIGEFTRSLESLLKIKLQKAINDF